MHLLRLDVCCRAPVPISHFQGENSRPPRHFLALSPNYVYTTINESINHNIHFSLPGLLSSPLPGLASPSQISHIISIVCPPAPRAPKTDTTARCSPARCRPRPRPPHYAHLTRPDRPAGTNRSFVPCSRRAPASAPGRRAWGGSGTGSRSWGTPRSSRTSSAVCACNVCGRARGREGPVHK